MKLVHPSEADRKRWDALVERHGGSVFSYSWYLDACAHDWYLFTDEKFENGIALPFTEKLGIKVISPPIFVRNLDFTGPDPAFAEKAFREIQDQFRAGYLQCMQQLQTPVSGSRVFQQIDAAPVLHKQAKRMLSKAVKSGVSVVQTTDWKPVLEIIDAELSAKISEFTPENIGRLEKLMHSLEKENKLFCLAIYRDGKPEGGMIFMDSGSRRVYLKGAATPGSRDAGGMYLCMNESVEDALSKNLVFDFGGSEVEGVRRFNVNLGGTDCDYYIYSWNNAPWWFNLTKWMYQKWKRK